MHDGPQTRSPAQPAGRRPRVLLPLPAAVRALLLLLAAAAVPRRRALHALRPLAALRLGFRERCSAEGRTNWPEGKATPEEGQRY